MAASNPTFRALYKPAEKVTNDGDEDEEVMGNGPANKRRRTANLSMRKSSTNKYQILLF
jgi:cohesin loading factor subunit SCC2